MPEAISIALVRRDRELRDFLAGVPDFDVEIGSAKDDWFSVSPRNQIELIARDGAGGAYLFYGADKRVVYITSEGQAGVIARDIIEAVSLMIECPYWHDLLKFSAGGSRHQMELASERLEQDLAAEAPEVIGLRARLRSRFGLRGGVDVITALHHAVSELGQGISVSTEDGWVLGGLFNKFTVESNPDWK